MKRVKLLSVLMMLCAAIGFTACEVEPVDSELIGNNPQPNNPNNPNNPQNPNGPATFTVDFNGQTFVATSVIANATDGLILIQGTRGTNGESVSIALPSNGVGTYDMEDLLMNYTPNAADEFGYSNISFATMETSGTVTITAFDEVNNTLSGTFSFKGWYGDENAGLAPIMFTNGAFNNVPYTGVIGGGDTFTANVNNVAYDMQDIVVTTADGGSGETISINALDGDLNHIDLFLMADITPGTYSFTNNPMAFPRARYSVGDVDYNSTSGTLVITSITDTRVAGTFGFIGTNGDGETVNVTQGTFDVEY